MHAINKFIVQFIVVNIITQPPIQWGPGTLTLGVKQSGCLHGTMLN